MNRQWKRLNGLCQNVKRTKKNSAINYPIGCILKWMSSFDILKKITEIRS
jgi:hypothetical protein